MRKRVMLFILSSMRALMTFKPYSWAANSDAMAATKGFSMHSSAARAVLATSNKGTLGKLVSNQFRHWAMAWGCEWMFFTSSITPDFDINWWYTSWTISR